MSLVRAKSVVLFLERSTDSDYYNLLEDHLGAHENPSLPKSLWWIRLRRALDVIFPHKLNNKSQNVSINQCTAQAIALSTNIMFFSISITYVFNL